MKKLQIWIPLIVALAVIGGMYVGSGLRKNIPFERNIFSIGNRSATQEVFDLIQHNYVDKVDNDSLTEDAIVAMLKQLDPHSVYIPSSYLSEVNEDLFGNFQGIGVEFMLIKDTVNVVKVIPGGPSEAAGLKIGDKLIKANDSLLVNLSNSEHVKKFLKGPAGSTVQVTLVRNNELLIVPIKRGNIPIPSVDAFFKIDDRTGFIHINKFSTTTYEEFMLQLEKLQQEGISRLIVDLRDNGGGILMEAVDIADEFLSGDKMIVYTQGDRKPTIEYKCKRPGLFEEGELIVLINENSASASEVLAGALQDWDRATIVGRRSFGKGLVQEQFDLSNGGAIRLTTARYYTPVGRNIQKPYGKNTVAYHHELLDRYNNGALTKEDTTHFGEAYKTFGGRTVYGGGGITPDVFVPSDTTTYSQSVYDVVVTAGFGQFIYQYYMNNLATLEQFNAPKDFIEQWNMSEAVWNEFLVFNDRKANEFTAKDKAIIAQRLKVNLAAQIWNISGYYQANAVNDSTIQKALSLLKADDN